MEVLSNQLGLSTSDVDQNPGFKALLQDLDSHYLSSNGTSLNLEKEVHEVETKLRIQRERYLKNSMIYEELQNIILENNLGENSFERPEVISTLEQVLAALEASNHVALTEDHPWTRGASTHDAKPQPGDWAGQTFFAMGVTPGNLAEDHVDQQVAENLSSFQQMCLPKIEDQLKKKLQTLFQFHSAQSETNEGSVLMASKMTAIHEAAEDMARKIESENSLLAYDQASVERKFWALHMAVGKILEVLWSILHDEKINRRVNIDETRVKALIAKAKTMSLKLGVVKYQLLSETYTPEAVAALQKIKHILGKDHRNALNEYERCKADMSQYNSIGESFRSLVDEFSALREQIEHKTDALNQINEHLHPEM